MSVSEKDCISKEKYMKDKNVGSMDYLGMGRAGVGCHFGETGEKAIDKK